MAGGKRVLFVFSMLCCCCFILCTSAQRTTPPTRRQCAVRNDLKTVEDKSYLAPVVFSGTVRSRGSPRGSNGVYEVTVEVNRVHKGSLDDRILRLRYRLPRDSLPTPPPRRRRRSCIAEAKLNTGDRYIVFVKYVGGVRNFTAVSTPEPHTRHVIRKVSRTVCRHCVRLPRVAPMKDVTVNLRQRLRLHCKARGRPQPDVSWYKDGKQLRSNRRTRIRTKRKRRRATSTLTVRRARPEDAGSYTCRARNVAGSRSKSAQVKVNRRSPARRPALPGRKKPRPKNVPLQAEACKIQSYCLNGGTCTSYPAVGELVCECAAGFKGKRCDAKAVYSIKPSPTVLESYPQLSTASFRPVMLVLGGATILLLFIVLIILLLKRYRPGHPTSHRNGGTCGNVGAITMATGEGAKQAATPAPPPHDAWQMRDVPRRKPVDNTTQMSSGWSCCCVPLQPADNSATLPRRSHTLPTSPAEAGTRGDDSTPRSDAQCETGRRRSLLAAETHSAESQQQTASAEAGRRSSAMSSVPDGGNPVPNHSGSGKTCTDPLPNRVSDASYAVISGASDNRSEPSSPPWTDHSEVLPSGICSEQDARSPSAGGNANSVVENCTQDTEHGCDVTDEPGGVKTIPSAISVQKLDKLLQSLDTGSPSSENQGTSISETEKSTIPNENGTNGVTWHERNGGPIRVADNRRMTSQAMT